MPTFMDRHDLPAGMTAEDVAAGHRKDVENQDRFGAKFRTYWFDHQCGAVFCLIEAPDAATAVRVPSRVLMAMMVFQPPSFRSILPRLRPSSGARSDPSEASEDEATTGDARGHVHRHRRID